MAEFKRVWQCSLVLPLVLAGSVATPQERRADEAVIRAQIAANVAAYNKRDAAGVAATYAPDGDHIAFASARSVGRDAIRGLLENRWSRGFVEATASIEAVRFLRPDVAVAEITTRFGAGDGAAHRLVARW